MLKVVGNALIGLGLLGAGYFVSTGLEHFSGRNRTVTVRGLAEKKVMADQAEWRLTFSISDPKEGSLRKRIEVQQRQVIDFLLEEGFLENELHIGVSTMRYNEGADKKAPYYSGGSSVKVLTRDVQKVQKAQGAIAKLFAQGVYLEQPNEWDANPSYKMTDFEKMRPALFEESIQSARTMAEQFAQAAGTKLKTIRTANQGLIEIQGSEGQSHHKSIEKKMRLVTMVTFELA